MNDILKNQNHPDLIKLLKASSVTYKTAKSGETLVLYFIIILALLYPPIFVYSNEYFQLILFGCSFFIVLFIEGTYGYLKGNTSKGALFKEEFDTALFGLPWKSTIRRDEKLESSIYSLKYKGPKISNWYSPHISNNIPRNIAIAVCQHTNTTWDIELRRYYSYLLKSILFLYAVCLFFFFVINNVKGQLIFIICFPMLSFYTELIKMIRGHLSVINKRMAISKHLDEIITNRKEISISELRDIQDEIYLTRLDACKVPNSFFYFFKDRLNSVSEDYIKSINKLYDIKNSIFPLTNK